MRKSTIINLIIVLASFGAAFYFYQIMPEIVASHWNARGQVDGYMSKFWGLFLMPLISLVLLLLFLIIPNIDPLKKDTEKLKNDLGKFSVAIMIFFFYIFSLTIAWNMGYRFGLIEFITPAFGALFFVCGFFIGKIKRNWFAGIRTPWTMSSDAVWDKTHRLGGKLFKLSGLISLTGIIFPQWAMFLVIGSVLLSTIFLFVYSYFVYRHEQR